MEKNKSCPAKFANVGGQAVMEGIMMRSPKKSVLAVRQSDGTIVTEEMSAGSIKDKCFFFRWPLVRGCVSFVESLIVGYKALSRSASLAGLEEETNGNKATETLIMVISVLLGVALAVGIFMLLPALAVKFLTDILKLDLGVFRALVEGIVRIILFIVYIKAVSFMKDIKRLFMYHGAEHKTIFCFEANEDLTIENIRKQSRLHPRCGTSFIFLVLIIGILFSSFITWDSLVVRLLLKLLCLPLIAGISYEFIRYAGRHDNWLTTVISAPGKAMQRITTAEPDDEMIEVAIVALKTSLTDENGILDMDCAYKR